MQLQNEVFSRAQQVIQEESGVAIDNEDFRKLFPASYLDVGSYGSDMTRSGRLYRRIVPYIVDIVPKSFRLSIGFRYVLPFFLEDSPKGW